MTYLDCLKQQLYLFSMGLIAITLSYNIALFFELRSPHQLPLQYIVQFSLSFIFVGAFFRLLNEKFKVYPYSN